MFSKFSVILVTLLTGMTLLTTGCDSKIGEEPPPPSSQEFSGTQCLSAVKPVVTAFVMGEAKRRDIEASWDCASAAVEKFKRYVRGRSSDRYDAQELATFLEKNFLSGEVITPRLQTEFMKLKQLFIGGSVEYVTREETDKLISLFGHFKQISVRINPYMKVLTMNWQKPNQGPLQEQSKFFEEANKEIQNAARSVAALIEENGQSYLLSDFVVLTEELSIFFGEKWDFPKTIARFMPVIQKVKKALAGGKENSIVPTEWGRFLLLGSRGYVQYLRYYYFIKSVPETGMAYRLQYLANSAEDLLSVFQDFVAQKPEGNVTLQELGDLLKTLGAVWPNFKVSDKLMLESMRVKQLLFGGNLEEFTTKDFEKARGKILRIKSVTERFLPYYLVYSGEWDPSIYDSDEAQKLFAEAQTALESALKEASVLLEGPYDLKNLIGLLEEVERLYPPEEGDGISVSLKKYLPLVIDAKNMIFSTNDTVVRKENWVVLAALGSRAYGDYLYYYYFIKGKEWGSPEALVAMSGLSNQALNLVKDLIGVKKEGYFTKSELSRIVSRLVAMDALPESLTPDVVSKVMDVVVNNILVAPERRIDGYHPNVLNASAVEVARQELQIWLDTQTWIARQTENMRAEQGIRPGRLAELLESAKYNKSNSNALRIGTGELLLSVVSPVPMTLDAEGRLNISNRQSFSYTEKSLTQLNMNRTVARILLRAFVNNRQRISAYTGANLSEVQSAFAALRPVLVEMGMIDAKNTTFAASRFREANIFVPHSDGNSLASFAEVTDLIGMIWSGININSKLRAHLLRDCFGGRTKVKNSEKVTITCAQSSYNRSFSRALSSMPEYIRYARTMTANGFYTHLENVFKAAGYIPNAQRVATLDQISLSPHVIQYIEMIYARFDRNHDDMISTEEAIKAYPAFKGILMELAKEQVDDGTLKEEELLDLFGFILKYGKPPETISEKLRFVFNWKGKQSSWNIAATRADLSQILGYIADQVNKAAKEQRPVKIQFNLEPSANR